MVTALAMCKTSNIRESGAGHQGAHLRRNVASDSPKSRFCGTKPAHFRVTSTRETVFRPRRAKFPPRANKGGAAMGIYEKGAVRIHFEEAGSGFPLLLIAGGGLNSTISNFTSNSPFNPIEEFKAEYRCIASDLRKANAGQSTSPLEIDRPWD